jgi:RecB family exonuclease
VEQRTIPDLESLRRTSFGPARVAVASHRDALPLTPVQWLDRAAATGEVPPAWGRDPHLELRRILALRDREGLGPADGILGSRPPFPVLPGLAPERAISASALQTLVGCPLRFLRERVLGWKEPVGAASVRELDALSFGGLFHRVAERFYGEHGADFVARKRRLPHWQNVLRAIAEEEFAALRVRYPLVGRGVEEKERSRLLRDLDTFLEYDSKLPLVRFVGVELSFDGVALDAGGTTLHVRGYVDRVDVEGDHALVRDLKTGRDHPRDGDEEGPTPSLDIQLGLYGLVAKRKAGEWGLPKKLQAAYVYPRSGEERAFRTDHAELEEATKEWLAVAGGLLEEHSFPPTPVSGDCDFCPYAPVCDGAARAVAAVDDAEKTVARFLALRVEPEEEGE